MNQNQLRVLLTAGEVLQRGDLIRQGGLSTFVKSASPIYDALRFMAYSCEDIDLRSKDTMLIWAEIPELEERLPDCEER